MGKGKFYPVYKSGFATTQEEYERNVTALFASLDRLEMHLATSHGAARTWLVGDRLTEADIRTFTKVVRFDAVYYGHFKCNLRTLEHGYPHSMR